VQEQATYEDPQQFEELLRAYYEGRLRTSSVSLFHFDLGVVETMGGVRDTAPNGTRQFYLKDVAGVPYAPDHPGVPIVFEVSDDLYRSHKLPAVVVRRTSMPFAMQRWHPGTRQYRVPAEYADPVQLADGRQGWTAYEERQQAIPMDLNYTITLAARNRGGGALGEGVNEAQNLLQYMWQFWQPYCQVFTRDSGTPPGDTTRRSYAAFLEGVDPEAQVLEVTGRLIGFNLNLRVEAEIDMNAADTYPAVSQDPTIIMEQHGGETS